MSIFDGIPGGNNLNFLPVKNRTAANDSDVNVSLSIGGINGKSTENPLGRNITESVIAKKMACLVGYLDNNQNTTKGQL